MPAAHKAIGHMFNIRMSGNVACRFVVFCCLRNLSLFFRSEREYVGSLLVSHSKSPDLQDSFIVSTKALAFFAMFSSHVGSFGAMVGPQGVIS